MKKKSILISDNFLVKLVYFGPFVFIPLVVVTVSYFILHLSQLQYKESIKDIKKSYIQSQKNQTISKVDIATKLIEFKQSSANNILKEKVKNRVDSAYSVAKNLYTQNIKNHTKQDVQKIIIDSLRPLIWNNGESFIFIIDFDGIFHLAPKYLQHLEGKSIINFQDATKRFVIKEEINVAKTKGEGYLWDTFTRPNYDKSKQFKQLAYVKKFDDFNWYMGSAEYLDTTKKEMQHDVLYMLQNTFLNQSGYFFIIDQDGNNVMNGQKLFESGVNILSLKDINGKEIVKELIKSANSKEPYFVSYKLKNPVTKIIEEKHSYPKKVPNTNWIIGTGFYMNSLNKQIEDKQNELSNLYQEEYKHILLTSLIVLIMSFIASYFISNQLREKFFTYTKTIENKNKELISLNESLEDLVNDRTKQLEKAYEDIKEVAIKDTLTKIYNRYFFNSALENEINRSKRYNNIFSLCMFDIDYFKNINDTFGHDVGDKVLKQTSQLIQDHLRDSDIFARVGGEEFMIIFPNIDLNTSFDIIERIRLNIEKYQFDEIKHLTISFGLVAYNPNDDKETLLKRADIALYEAKHNGRNQVVINA